MSLQRQEGDLFPVEVVYEAVAPFLRQMVPPVPRTEDRYTIGEGIGRLFSYSAPPVALAPAVEAAWEDADVMIEQVSYQTGPATRATALIALPRHKTTRIPGVLLFHCHSGVYRWGSEKVCHVPSEASELATFRQEKYAGRSLAHELARQGFCVMAPDAFYFGRRALRPRDGTDSPTEVNLRCRASEVLVAKMLTLAGQSWFALLAWEDRRALDYLCTRSEVDPARLGCIGLSLGGTRAMTLAAQDHRIGAVAAAGCLTTVADLLRAKVEKHSWMVLPWGILPELDFPLLAAHAYPAAFLALFCSQDHLFTLAGMRTAAEMLTAAYAHNGAADRCRAEFFHEPHRMTLGMQERAFAWLQHFLGDAPTQ